MRSGVRRAVVLALVVPVAGLTLAGCGDVSPGAAATVDGAAIPLDQVDAMAESVCAAELTYSKSNETEWQPQPLSTYRDNVLGVLINEQLAVQAADGLDLDVPPSMTQPPDNAALDGIYSALDTGDEEAFRDYLAAFGRLQALYFAIGQDQQGDSDDAQEDPQAVGQAYVADYADDHDVELDPRFGDFEEGQVAGGSGSLSAPLEPTETTVPAPGAPPDVSGLPDSQICQ